MNRHLVIGTIGLICLLGACGKKRSPSLVSVSNAPVSFEDAKAPTKTNLASGKTPTYVPETSEPVLNVADFWFRVPQQVVPPMRMWGIGIREGQEEISSATGNDKFVLRFPLERFVVNHPAGHILHLRPAETHCTGVGLVAGVVGRNSGRYVPGGLGMFQGQAASFKCGIGSDGTCHLNTFSLPLSSSPSWRINPIDTAALDPRGQYDLVLNWIYNTEGTCNPRDPQGFGIRASYGVAAFLQPADFPPPPPLNHALFQ